MKKGALAGEAMISAFPAPVSSFGTFVKSSNWAGQSFTPDQDFTLTGVKLRARRSPGESPGNIYVGVRYTSDKSAPDLVTGSIDGNAIPDTGSNIIDVPIPGDLTLNMGTEYFITIRAESSTDTIGIFGENDNIYTEGKRQESPNGGSFWVEYTYDHYFEIWGTTAAPSLTCPLGICDDDTITYQEFIDVGNYWING